MKTHYHTIASRIDFEKKIDHPNILIAANFWEEERFLAARQCYKFMRAIDDMIDDRKSEGKALNSTEKQLFTEKVNTWINGLLKPENTDPFITGLSETISRFKIPLQLFHNFARSMQFDIDHNGFETFNEFLKYAEGASVAPASVFVHLCCLSKSDKGFTPPPFDVIDVARPCAIFSYIVHIIRDFEKDQKNHLNYFALDILKKHGLTPEDLRQIAYGEPVSKAFRGMIGEYMQQAQLWGAKTLLEIQKLNPFIKGQYMLSLQIIYNLYLQVYQKIDVEKGNFSTEELNPSPDEIKQNVYGVFEMVPD